jgi:hypothetical protein
VKEGKALSAVDGIEREEFRTAATLGAYVSATAAETNKQRVAAK